MRKKLGIFNEEADDLKLAEDLLMHMQKNKADFTNTFRALSSDAINSADIYQDGGFRNWLEQWQARLSRQKESFEDSVQLMHAANPKVIPRNHLVEEALSAAVDKGDTTVLNTLLQVLSDPYADLDHLAKYTEAPTLAIDQNFKTFCGT